MKLDIKNINKELKNIKILDDFSLTVNEGEIAIILGKSGAGKSTILRILNNLDTLDSGQILLNNIPINEYQEKKIGIVFQNFNLFSNLSVIENITLALIQVKKIDKIKATQIGCNLLKKYHLLEKKNEPIHSLSGGQKQKIAIVRTLAMESKVICFDEPVSSLDPYSTNEILTFIKELQKENYIIIMTTHNMSIFNQLNCTINLLHNGNITESNKSEDFFNENNKNNNSQLHKFIHGIL